MLSTWLTIGAVAGSCTLDRTWRCVRTEGVRIGLALVAVESAKALVARRRPNGVDDRSFYSQHTTLACVATLRTKLWAVCPAVGYLRLAADWHWSTDVATGAAVGGLLTTVRW